MITITNFWSIFMITITIFGLIFMISVLILEGWGEKKEDDGCVWRFFLLLLQSTRLMTCVIINETQFI